MFPAIHEMIGDRVLGHYEAAGLVATSLATSLMYVPLLEAPQYSMHYTNCLLINIFSVQCVSNQCYNL